MKFNLDETGTNFIEVDKLQHILILTSIHNMLIEVAFVECARYEDKCTHILC